MGGAAPARTPGILRFSLNRSPGSCTTPHLKYKVLISVENTNLVDSLWTLISSVATLVTSVATLGTLLFYIHQLLKKPELDVEFDYSKLDYADSVSSMAGGMSIVYKTVRVKVTNIGKATAEECVAKAEIMGYQYPTFKEAIDVLLSDKNPLPNLLETVILHWTRNLDTSITKLDEIDYSNEDKFERLFKPINIAVNDYEFADLIIIGKELLGNEKPERYTILRCNLNPNIKPNNDNLWLKGGIIIKVIIYCRNVTSKSLCIQLKRGVPDEVSSGNKDAYFEEIECPKITREQ